MLVDPTAFEYHTKKLLWHETNAFRWAAAYIVKNQISGDYAEFGVWKGKSFIEAYHQIQSYSRTFYEVGLKGEGGANPFNKIRYHAFDSFQGLPAVESTAHPRQYFAGNYSADESLFLGNLKTAGVDQRRVTVTAGWFNESLTRERGQELELEKLAMVYVDCDLFESTVDILNFIRPYIHSGTVLIFDDWFRNGGVTTNGVQGATIKWLEANPEIRLQHLCNTDTRTAVFVVELNPLEKSSAQITCV